MTCIKILFVADTHLGFDLPFKARVARRRRGHDFFANFERALQPAFQGGIDLVVHGGDLLFRTRVPPALVDMALTPLVRVAEHGIPIFLVPGNHERSRIPMQLWGYHPNLHIFDRPRTFICPAKGIKLGLAGFPFVRDVRTKFRDLLEQTGYQRTDAGIYVLCIHQAVEGAQVGPTNYTFRSGADVISGPDIPGDVAVVLSGHIHRAQVLTRDLRGGRLAAPVIYPGSIERTSFAERNEPKGYQIISICEADSDQAVQVKSDFVQLPARPMVDLHLNPERVEDVYLMKHVKDALDRLDPDSIVRLYFDNLPGPWISSILSAAKLRKIAPERMNISLASIHRQERTADNA